MDAIPVEKRWSPEVRSIAARLNADLAASDRAMRERVRRGWDEERVLLLWCAEEALALARMMLRLGYGQAAPRSPATEGIELELDVMERRQDAYISFWRALDAVRKGKTLRTALSWKGRRASAHRTEGMTVERRGKLEEALRWFREEDPWLSPDYAPWVRPAEERPQERSGTGTGLPGASKLSLTEKLLEELVEDLRGPREPARE